MGELMGKIASLAALRVTIVQDNQPLRTGEYGNRGKTSRLNLGKVMNRFGRNAGQASQCSYGDGEVGS
jgi:hypothetical protein